MTIRCVPCPRCKRVPETEVTESGEYRTKCTTARCRCHLVCIGATEDGSRECWNNCIDAGDYR